MVHTRGTTGEENEWFTLGHETLQFAYHDEVIFSWRTACGCRSLCIPLRPLLSRMHTASGTTLRMHIAAREVETFGEILPIDPVSRRRRRAARAHRRRKGVRDPRMTSTKRPRDDPFDARPRDARPRGADAERSFECRV